MSEKCMLKFVLLRQTMEITQTFGVSAKIWGFYTLGSHYSCVYPNFVDLPKTCYLDVIHHAISNVWLADEQNKQAAEEEPATFFL